MPTRLARAEEREIATRFGRAWRDYAAGTPAFVPRRRPAPPGGGARPTAHGGLAGRVR